MSSRLCRMTSSRTSIAALVLTLTASGAALSQTATAPPRQLGGQQTTNDDQHSDVSSGDLSDDSAPAPKAAPPRRTCEQPPDVSTDDLLDDSEPEPTRNATRNRPSDAPPEGTYPDHGDSAPAG